ncbi:MAG: alpha-L-arabinofuranosidase C-terminal domain-containing protein [Bryobacteraceae bacterium]
MSSTFSRRRLIAGAAGGSILSLLPRGLAQASKTERLAVRADLPIGVVRPELHGHFAEHLGSCVYGGLWVGKQSPIPNVDGFRREAIDALRELGIPVLRWPGGCFADDYHWRDGIGKDRPKRVNIHWGDYVEDNSFGVHEFMDLCRKIGAEPYLAGNVGSSNPQELRDWVEYCNYPSGSTLSDERRANGSPEPFGVRYWGVGNENWGCGGRMTPEHYANLFRQFSGYVRTFGGTRPFLIACGPNGNDVGWSRKFLDQAGSRLPDGFAMHFYENSDKAPTQFTPDAMHTQMRIFERVENAVIQQRAILDGYDPQRKTAHLMVDEWGVWDNLNVTEEQKKFGRLWQQSTMRSAVAAALGLNLFHRQADKLYMCNIAQIVNVLQSLLLTDGAEGKRCVRTTTYHAFMLLKGHRGKTAVRVERAGSDPLGVSMSASKSATDMVVTFVNPRHGVDLSIDCALHGVTARGASAQILHHPDLNAFNSFDEPGAIVPKPHRVAVDGGRLRLDLPSMAIVTARIPLA